MTRSLVNVASTKAIAALRRLNVLGIFQNLPAISVFSNQYLWGSFVESIAIIGGILGILTGLVSLLTIVWRTAQATANIRNRLDVISDRLQDGDRSLDHQLETMKLTINGVRERMEHINNRLQNEQKDLRGDIKDVQAYLQKNTEFEIRNRR